LTTQKLTPADEIKVVADSLERWLPDHSDQTVAVLSPRNQRAFELADELRKRSLPYLDDFLRSSTSTRTSAGSLALLLRHLADPQSASRLAQAFLVWRRSDRNDQSSPLLHRTAELLRKITHVEDYIWPASGRDWLLNSNLDQSDPASFQLLSEYRQSVQRWHGSIILPIDQLILFLSQDILTTPAELAVAHKLALLMRQASNIHPDWRLPQLTNELVAIARNERRFLGFSDSDTGFNPDMHRGVVVISTLHKAKGLEWDRIYLMSVNNYDFPSGQENDSYIPEKWFLRPGINLQAETLGQLKAALSRDAYASYSPGICSSQARLDYIKERLRLLYVGITRARKELIVSWNSGRLGNLTPAVPLLHLADYVQNKQESI
jgi:DNA helicase-2/ATP-dependent DNA helicase PcrA